MYDIANEDTSVYLVDREKLRTKNLGLKGGSSQFSFLTNGFSLTRLPDAHNIGVWELDWIPSFSIAFHNLTYESSTAFLDQTDFQLFRTSLGFGPELSYQTSLGRFAGSVTPGIAYSWISYSSPVSGGSVGRSNLNLSFSLLYTLEIAHNLALRMFFKEIVEDTQVWRASISASQGFDIPVKQVLNTVTGFSIGLIW